MRLLAGALLLCAALPVAVPAAAQESAGVAGRVTLDVEGVRLADLGQTVVFVDDGGGVAPPAKKATIRQRNAYFAPDFLAIAVGQSVDMPNDDQIFHNVFSFSKPNDFDLGLYPAGQSRQVTFKHAGVVKIYCSIHESMSGTIFVSPTPWFAVAKGNGDFEIAGIPPGKHTLRIWNEKLPEATRTVVLEPGERERVDIQLETGAH